MSDNIYMEQSEYDAYVAEGKRQEEELKKKHKENAKNPIAQMTVYELNQGLMAQAPDYSDENRENAAVSIGKFHEKFKNKHYMLLSQENKYYTLFQIKNHPDLFGSEVVETLRALGGIKSIEVEENAVGAWVEVLDAGSPVMKVLPTYFLLFPYDRGVIQV